MNCVHQLIRRSRTLYNIILLTRKLLFNISNVKFKRELRKTRKKKEAEFRHRQIKIIFELWEPSFWKCDALYKALQNDSRFNSAIWINDSPNSTTPELKEKNRNLAINFVLTNGYKYHQGITAQELIDKESPDYLFIVQPYDNCVPINIEKNSHILVCHIPYSYKNLEGASAYMSRNAQLFHRYYTESESLRLYVSLYMSNSGRNVRATGLPIASQLSSKNIDTPTKNIANNKIVIIWAPHWTIPIFSRNEYNVSTFTLIADDFLNLITKYKESVHFIFKPHPRLKRALYEDKNWGKQKTDSYYAEWENKENRQLAEGEYVSLFRQSSAMIHDSASFIQEYLLVDKPCMYLTRDDAMVSFNRDTKDALNCYYKGNNVGDIDKFIQNVLNGIDPLCSTRKQYIKAHLISDFFSPVNNIISDLLKPATN